MTEWSNNLSAESYGDTVIPAKGGVGDGKYLGLEVSTENANRLISHELIAKK